MRLTRLRTQRIAFEKAIQLQEKREKKKVIGVSLGEDIDEIKLERLTNFGKKQRYVAEIGCLGNTTINLKTAHLSSRQSKNNGLKSWDQSKALTPRIADQLDFGNLNKSRSKEKMNKEGELFPIKQAYFDSQTKTIFENEIAFLEQGKSSNMGQDHNEEK